MLDEQQFRDSADVALNSLLRALERAADQYDFEVDSNAGALSVAPGRVVVGNVG